MSIFDPDELELLDYVSITTTENGAPLTVTTPNGEGCTTTVIGADGRPLKWEVREGAGLSGASQVYRGKGLAEWSIVLEMSSQDEENRIAMRAAFEQWDQVVEAAPPGEPAKVYQIGYPILALRGITQCTFLGEPLLEHDKTTQIDKITYKCREYRKPLPTVSAVTAPGGNTADGKAKDEFTLMVEGRGAELSKLTVEAGLVEAPPVNP